MMTFNDAIIQLSNLRYFCYAQAKECTDEREAWKGYVQALDDAIGALRAIKREMERKQGKTDYEELAQHLRWPNWWELEDPGETLLDDAADAIIALAAENARLRAQQELESNSKVVKSNDPLTMDELREMEGEPVYIVENTEYWSIINGFDQKGVYLLSHENPDDYGYFGLYGKTWIAYRRKPEEADHER